MSHAAKDKKDNNIIYVSSIDNEEIEHFAKDSDSWWDEKGSFAPLHRLNPVRLSFIKKEICKHMGRDFDNIKALKGIDILDIGCGGGLVCEPMARMGANITGVDADLNAIKVARAHAKIANLDIEYKNGELKDIGKKYDVVLALEIIEHVTDTSLFIEQCAKHVKPDGLLIISTLNRTAKSYALGIIAAEHILRWVPKGTHSWNKFVKPSEIAREARNHSFNAKTAKGLIFNPLKNEFSLSDNDLDVNYIISLSR